MVRLRGKPCPFTCRHSVRGGEGEKRVERAGAGREPPPAGAPTSRQASVGSKTRSAARGANQMQRPFCTSPSHKGGRFVDVAIRSRHMELPEDVRDIVEEKLTRVGRFLDG